MCFLVLGLPPSGSSDKKLAQFAFNSYSTGTSNRPDFELKNSNGEDLSEHIKGLANVQDPVFDKDVPFFWFIPCSGSESILDIMSSCLNVMYLDIDTKSERLDYAVKPRVDHVVVSGLVYQASSIFRVSKSSPSGRTFTMIPHPVKRSVDAFHKAKFANYHDHFYNPSLSNITLQEWIKSPIENNNFNLMTRLLSRNFQNDLTYDDLRSAKEILERKVLIGLNDEKDESLLRFDSYFNWTSPGADVKQCEEQYLNEGFHAHTNSPHAVEELSEGSDIYNLLRSRSMFDMELYAHARILFNEQSRYFR
eukprot:CAMPEP_0194397036 /NCGR_PEP_ID=MMETSP0174-20130528/125321_1 /TAXON_ID=216777 /ORGANISM="Proboscia alata, Strain PI-D3" /LENGTH=306 /DNA_ID=CAMNT_0039193169 /DNA_START=4732 /DNA_END=5652 /DNA_ORIENTATION=-